MLNQKITKKLAAFTLACSLLILAGCGIKSELDLPPNADIDASGLTAAAVSALDEQKAERHDRYAIYYTPEEYEELFRSVSGSYGGIGVYITADEATGGALIYGVMKNGPAYQAGMLPGDVLVSLNGEDLTALTYEEVADKMIAFPVGTRLELIVERPEEGRVTLDVTTAQVDIPTVDSAMLADNIGLIKIASFNQTTGEQFISAYDELVAQGMQKMIIDLRNNGGGELTAALQICNYFVPKGEAMMYITGTDGEYSYRSNREALDMPVVILQNGHTASASEVLIGAAQDNGKATLLGEVTYGKGIVQDLRQLKSGAGLRYTSAKYSTAHKNDIHGVGIKPDVYFPMPEDADKLAEYTMDPAADPQLAKAVELISAMGAAQNE